MVAKYDVPTYVFRCIGGYTSLEFHQHYAKGIASHKALSMKQCVLERFTQFLSRQKALNGLAKGNVINNFKALEFESICTVCNEEKEVYGHEKPLWAIRALLPRVFWTVDVLSFSATTPRVDFSVGGQPRALYVAIHGGRHGHVEFNVGGHMPRCTNHSMATTFRSIWQFCSCGRELKVGVEVKKWTNVEEDELVKTEEVKRVVRGRIVLEGNGFIYSPFHNITGHNGS
eukprot:Gb_00811 [translate_table: standard]